MSFNLIDTLAVGVDRILRTFEPLQRQLELWRKTQVTDERAKLILYNAFIDRALGSRLWIVSVDITLGIVCGQVWDMLRLTECGSPPHPPKVRAAIGAP